MLINELKRLLTSMQMAAEVVEAIEDPSLQKRRGWDLAGWTYEMVPWGVIFVRKKGTGREKNGIAAIAIPESMRSRMERMYDGHRRMTVLMLG
jgi:hypothetical protein